MLKEVPYAALLPGAVDIAIAAEVNAKELV
jgi:hypothetical protein